VNGQYGTSFLAPTIILGGRLLKFGTQIDFCAGGNEDMAAVMRVHRVRDEAVHRCSGTTVQPIREHGID
jgi:hypothetical protein